MRIAIVALLLLVATTGCVSELIEGFLLTSQEQQALEDNMTAIFDTNNMTAEWVYAASRGDLDLSQFNYTAPSAANNWMGRIDAQGATLPFGDGNFVLDFMVTGDSGPVDPYDPAVDLTDDQNVVVDAVFTFAGTSLTGAPLNIDGDVNFDTVQNGLDRVVVDLAGDVSVAHGGYITDLNVSNLQATLDMIQGEVIDLQGSVQGEVDIPGFFFPAQFDLQALGPDLDVLVEASLSFFGFDIQLPGFTP